MKSNEFLDEGVMDWMSKKGWLGTEKQALAYSKADMQLAQAKWYQKFFNDLKTRLAGEQLSESHSDITYSEFDLLLESKILKEAPARTIEQSVKEYMLYQLQKNAIKPTAQENSEIDNLITDFATAYRNFGRKFTEVMSKPLADKIWIMYKSSREEAAPSQQRQATPLDAGPDEAHWKSFKSTYGGVIPPTGKGAGQPIPDEPELSITVGGGAARKFKFDFAQDKWVDITDPAVPKLVADSASTEKLNKEYYEYYFRATP